MPAPEVSQPPHHLCLARSGVLAIGLIGSTLAISGLVAYAIVQVPTLREHLGQYFTNTTIRMEEEASLRYSTAPTL